MNVSKDCKSFGSADKIPFGERRTIVVRWDSPHRIERMIVADASHRFVIHAMTIRNTNYLAGSVAAYMFSQNAFGMRLDMPTCQEIAIEVQNVGAYEERWSWVERFCQLRPWFDDLLWGDFAEDWPRWTWLLRRVFVRPLQIAQRFVRHRSPKVFRSDPLPFSGMFISAVYS